MKKSILLFFCCVFACSIHAQHAFKVAVLQGIAVQSNNSNDSIFFSEQHYTTQIKLGYHIGKLGIISKTNYIVQTGSNAVGRDNRIKGFDVQGFDWVYKNYNTIQTSLGLELCIPTIRKQLNTNIHFAYGISTTSGDSTTLKDVQNLLYSNKPNRKITSTIQAGVAFQYKINPIHSILVGTDFNTYSIAYDGYDSRKLLNTFSSSQTKNLLSTYLGYQIKF
jgi:hypothetical protein